MLLKISYLVTILCVLYSCTQKQQGDTESVSKTEVYADAVVSEEVSVETLPFKVIRTERFLFEERSKTKLKSFLNAHPFFTKEFLQITAGDFEDAVDGYHSLIINPSLDSLYRLTQTVYGEMGTELTQLSEAFVNYQQYFKLKKLPTIYTAITGMSTDMYVGDTAMVIGLEFFLAEKSKYRPNLPLYIGRRYRREYIVPYLMTFYGMRHIESDLTDNSMLAEMIFYGKTYLFVKKMLPALPDTLLFGFSKEQLDDVNKNQKIIWKHFVDNSLLFDTRQDIVTKYVGERPSVPEIGSKCPGRIGRWLGYQILLSYLTQHSEASLVQVLQTKDAKKLFNLSKYKPQ